MEIRNVKVNLTLWQRLYIKLFGCPHPMGITLNKGKSYKCGVCKRKIGIN